MESDLLKPKIMRATPWHAGLESRHWRVLAASFLGWAFDGYETYALIVVLPFALKSTLAPDQLHSQPVWAGVVISATLLGWGIGGLAGGVAADYIGRKRMMIYSVLLYALFTGLTALSYSLWSLLAFRFLTGVAIGSEWSTGVALLAETWPDRARPKGAGILQSGFGWGALLASMIWFLVNQAEPFGRESWRLMFLIGILPAFFALYIRRSIDESERWQMALRAKRWAATEEDSHRAHATGTPSRRPFSLAAIFREPESRRRVLLAFLLALATTAGWWAISSWLPTYATQVARTEGYTNPAAWGARIAMIYTAGAVVGYLLSGFIADAIGRRRFLFFTFLGALIATPITYLWTHSIQALVWAAGLSGFFTLGLAFSWMAIYPVELFTSTVRSTAASFVFNAARLIAWLFPIAAGTLIQYFGGIARAATIIGSIYVLGLIVPWFMPETRGKPLPE